MKSLFPPKTTRLVYTLALFPLLMSCGKDSPAPVPSPTTSSAPGRETPPPAPFAERLTALEASSSCKADAISELSGIHSELHDLYLQEMKAAQDLTAATATFESRAAYFARVKAYAVACLPKAEIADAETTSLLAKLTLVSAQGSAAELFLQQGGEACEAKNLEIMALALKVQKNNLSEPVRNKISKALTACGVVLPSALDSAMANSFLGHLHNKLTQASLAACSLDSFYFAEESGKQIDHDFPAIAQASDGAQVLSRQQAVDVARSFSALSTSCEAESLIEPKLTLHTLEADLTAFEGRGAERCEKDSLLAEWKKKSTQSESADAEKLLSSRMKQTFADRHQALRARLVAGQATCVQQKQANLLAARFHEAKRKWSQFSAVEGYSEARLADFLKVKEGIQTARAADKLLSLTSEGRTELSHGYAQIEASMHQWSLACRHHLAEIKRRAEEELKRVEEEKRKEELRKRAEEEKRKLEDEKNNQEERRRLEEEKKKEDLKRAEEQQRKDAERKRLEDEQKKQNELKRAEEQKRQLEEQKKIQEEQRKEAERKRVEEAQRKLEEQRKAAEEKKRQLDEQKKIQEEQRKEAERKRVEEAQRKLEEQKRAQEEQRKIAEEKKRQLDEQKKIKEEQRKEAERKRLEELQRKKLEEQQRKEELQKRQEEEKRAREEALKKMEGDKARRAQELKRFEQEKWRGVEEKRRRLQPPLWGESPGRKAWTDAVISVVRARMSALEKARDVNLFCPGYFSAEQHERENCWLLIVTAISKRESNFATSDSFTEGNGVDSIGLLALSAGECPNAPTAKSLGNPVQNLICGVNKMAYLVARDGMIDDSAIGSDGTKKRGSRGAAAYWSTLSPRHKVYHKGKGRWLTNIGHKAEIMATSRKYKSVR